MSRFRHSIDRTLTALAIAGLVFLGAVGLMAQYPTGVPTSVRSNLYGMLYGGTFSPSGTGGALFRIAGTIRPTGAAGQQTFAGLSVAPTFAVSGANTAISISEFAGARFEAPTITNTNATSITNVAGVVVDAQGTAGTNNYGLWSKGRTRQDGDMYVSTNIAMATTTNLSIPVSSAFGTSAAVFGNQFAFAVNVGTGGTAVSGVVIFGTPFTKVPVCIPSTMQAVTINNGNSSTRVVSAAVDSIKISADTAWLASTTINVLCFGKAV